MSSRRLTATLLAAAMAFGGVALVERISPAAAASPTSAASTRSGQASPTLTTAAELQLDTSRLDAIVTDARFAVAVLDQESGQLLTHGDIGTFDTASIVKVDILAALLDAQDGELGETQQVLAAAMIQYSDNDAADVLFDQIGGVAGLEAYNATLGLTGTTVAESWGLTQTTPADQIVVLQAVLQAVLRHEVAQDLMGQVVEAQRFGVSAAADQPEQAQLKVGYLQRSLTGQWDVTSIGAVTAGGRDYLVAVLSDGSASLDAGVALVEAVAEAAVPSGSSDRAI